MVLWECLDNQVFLEERVTEVMKGQRDQRANKERAELSEKKVHKETLEHLAIRVHAELVVYQ